MNSPPDFVHLFIRQFWQILKADWSVLTRLQGGQREDRTRTTRYSCSTVVGHVIVNRETRVQTRLDHQSGTKNDILLGVHKNLCFSSYALSREPPMLRCWAWILHLLILNGSNILELACNRGSGILLPRISLGCELQSCWDSCTVQTLFNTRWIYIRGLLALYVPTPRTVLKPSRHNFFDLSTLYWVGKGKGLWIFKMISLRFRTVLVIHIELLLCSYCPKDFCPGLQTPLFANSIPHLHISCNTPCLHPPNFLTSPECYSRPKRNWRQWIYRMFGGQTKCSTADKQMANGTQSRLWGLAAIVGVEEKWVISKGQEGVLLYHLPLG